LINDLLELIGISSCWLFLQFLAMPLIKNGWNGHFSKAKWWMGSQTLVLSSSILGRDWTAVSSSSIYIIELEICCRRTPRLLTPRSAVFFKTNPMSQWSRIVFPMFDGHLGLYRVSPGSVFLGQPPSGRSNRQSTLMSCAKAAPRTVEDWAASSVAQFRWWSSCSCCGEWYTERTRSEEHLEKSNLLQDYSFIIGTLPWPFIIITNCDKDHVPWSSLPL
jgi:hypothetical protein